MDTRKPRFAPGTCVTYGTRKQYGTVVSTKFVSNGRGGFVEMVTVEWDDPAEIMHPDVIAESLDVPPTQDELREKAVRALTALRDDAVRLGRVYGPKDGPLAGKHVVDAQVYDVAVRAVRGRA